MLIDGFVHNTLLDTNEAAMAEAIARARETLRDYEFDVFRFDSIEDEAHITLAANVVDVFAVSYDRRLLTRASEAVLDANAPEWRSEESKTPKSWLFRGEVPNGLVRLRPAPDESNIPIHVLASWQPNLDQLMPWQELYVALHAINTLAISDPLRARLPLGEFASLMLKTYKESL